MPLGEVGPVLGVCVMKTNRKIGRPRGPAVPDALVAQMAADYASGMSLKEVGQRYGDRDSGGIAVLLKTRGYKLRPVTRPMKPNGQFVAFKRLTEADIENILQRTTMFKVPAEMRWEWRKWDLARRADFIARLRARLNPRQDQPTTPFSDNVQPFAYGTPEAHAILDKQNAGLPSRLWKSRMFPISQGVIWDGRLWFWAHKMGYIEGTKWVPGIGRRLLPHAIWAKHHGKPVPAGHVLRLKDGNPNNLRPENFILESRNDVCRQNQATALMKKSRAMTALLLKRSQKSNRKNEDENNRDNITAIRLGTAGGVRRGRPPCGKKQQRRL